MYGENTQGRARVRLWHESGRAHVAGGRLDRHAMPRAARFAERSANLPDLRKIRAFLQAKKVVCKLLQTGRERVDSWKYPRVLGFFLALKFTFSGPRGRWFESSALPFSFCFGPHCPTRTGTLIPSVRFEFCQSGYCIENPIPGPAKQRQERRRSERSPIDDDRRV